MTALPLLLSWTSTPTATTAAITQGSGHPGYVEGNRFFETYRGAGDDFFVSVDPKPEFYPIYW